MSKRLCPICNSEKNKKLEQVKMSLPPEYQLPIEYNVVQCENCGFCYSDTEATEDDYNFYYSNCNIYSGMPSNEEAWDYRFAKNIIKKYLNKDNKILDMGFGRGDFLHWLKVEGYSDIMGIDPSDESVNAVKGDGINAVLGSVFQIQNEFKNSFDCIVLFDVLEHLLLPMQAVNNLKHYLKVAGYLLVSVPNYANLKENNNPIPNVFNQEHINYFSQVSLDNLMLNYGFRKVAVGAESEDYKEIIALYQADVNCDKADMVKDIHTVNSIEEYLSRFNLKRKLTEEVLLNIKVDGIKKIYVWGTGAYTMWLLSNSMLDYFDIQFIDNNDMKIENEFCGKKIMAPPPRGELDPTIPIVICSMLYSKEIVRQIKETGLKNEIYVL